MVETLTTHIGQHEYGLNERGRVGITCTAMMCDNLSVQRIYSLPQSVWPAFMSTTASHAFFLRLRRFATKR